jgi:hypothetical protein
LLDYKMSKHPDSGNCLDAGDTAPAVNLIATQT